MQFADILAGDAARPGKPQREPVVEVVAAGGIAQPDMARDPGWRQQAGERFEGRPRCRTGQADDRDRGAPRRGCRGVDRVGWGFGGPQCFGGS
jgi:hypothetical protein